MGLQNELKRREPFASPQQEAMLNLLRTADQLENRLARFFRAHDLTVSRFNVLRSLALADGPLTCGEIGERMIQVVPAITCLVDHLEKQGLVQRQRCDVDRRVVHVRITATGRQVTAAAIGPLRDLEQRLCDGLAGEDLPRLIGLLEKTRVSIAASDRQQDCG